MKSAENLPGLNQKGTLPHPAPGEQTHILLVDDDDTLRTLIKTCLEKLGYAVSSADSGKTALQTAAEKKDIQLLLTDVLMPRIASKRWRKIGEWNDSPVCSWTFGTGTSPAQ